MKETDVRFQMSDVSKNRKSKIVNRKFQKEGVRKMKKLIGLGLGILMVCALSQAAFAQSTADVDVLVTPKVVATISVDPISYNFGELDLAISSNSASGTVCPELQNEGEVSIDLEKTVWTVTPDAPVAADWSLAIATGTINEFVFWAETSTDTTEGNRPAISDFKDGAGYETSYSSFSLAEQDYNILYKADNTQQVLAPKDEAFDSAALWFRIDMPDGVTNSDERTIEVRIKAIAQ